MARASKIVSFFIFPTLVFLGHLIAGKVLHLYARFPNIDIPFHYIGGLSIAYASTKVLSYLASEKITSTLNKAISVVLILSLTATAAVLWEFMEFGVDQLLNTHLQRSLANTMQDQFLGILGGSTWTFIYFKRDRK